MDERDRRARRCMTPSRMLVLHHRDELQMHVRTAMAEDVPTADHGFRLAEEMLAATRIGRARLPGRNTRQHP